MEAAGVLKDVPYKVDWKEFAAAAPLLEALNAGAIDTGIVGDAPFTFAKAAGLKAKTIAAVRQNPQGLAILVRKGSPIKTVEDLEGRVDDEAAGVLHQGMTEEGELRLHARPRCLAKALKSASSNLPGSRATPRRKAREWPHEARREEKSNYHSLSALNG